MHHQDQPNHQRNHAPSLHQLHHPHIYIQETVSITKTSDPNEEIHSIYRKPTKTQMSLPLNPHSAQKTPIFNIQETDPIRQPGL